MNLPRHEFNGTKQIKATWYLLEIASSCLRHGND